MFLIVPVVYWLTKDTESKDAPVQVVRIPSEIRAESIIINLNQVVAIDVLEFEDATNTVGLNITGPSSELYEGNVAVVTRKAYTELVSGMQITD